MVQANRRWKRVIVPAIAALVIASAAGLWLRKSGPNGQTPPAASGAGPKSAWQFAFDFPMGQTLLYRLSIRTRQSATASIALEKELNGQHLGGSAVFDGTIALTRKGQRDGAQLIGLRIEELTTYGLEAFGKQVVSDLAEASKLMVGPEAILAIRGDGRIDAVYFDPSSSSLFKRHVQGFVAELQLKLCHAEGTTVCSNWQAEERIDAGRAVMSYAVEGPYRLTAKPKHYTFISALGEGVDLSKFDVQHAGGKLVELSPEGYVKELQDHRELVARELGNAAAVVQAGQQFSLRFGSMRPAGRVSLPDLGTWERQGAGEQRIDPATARRMLLQRVAGLTRDELLQGIEVRSVAGSYQGNDGWFTRATGLLLLEPDLCDIVASLAQTQGASQGTRTLAVDLLAGAGSVEAQRALRRLLQSGAARDGDWADTYQRVSFVKKPDTDTVRLTIDTYKERKPAAGSKETSREYTAAALTLGTMAKRLNGADRQTERDEIIGELRTELNQPRTDEDLAVTVRALGNAGVASTLTDLLGFVSHPNPVVRAAVATALRQFDAPQAVAALLTLAVDPVAAVEAAAISSLRGKPLDAGQLGAVCRALTNDHTDPVVLPGLMTLVEGAESAPLQVRMECAARLAQLPGHEDDGLQLRAGTFLERAAASQ